MCWCEVSPEQQAQPLSVPQGLSTTWGKGGSLGPEGGTEKVWEEPLSLGKRAATRGHEQEAST